MLFEDINVDPETGDVTFRIEVNNTERKLLPGMYVRVNIDRASIPQALLVPAQAIQRNISGEPQVYVINAQGQRKFVLSKLDSNMSSSISLTKA